MLEDGTGSRSLPTGQLVSVVPTSGIGSIRDCVAYKHDFPREQSLKHNDCTSLCGSDDHGEDSRGEDDRDDDSAPATIVSFKYSETDKVIEYLHEALNGFQQALCKRFAKLLIKKICPKKQSRWSYAGKVVPPFWPEDVIHREPDHLKRQQRVKLLAHLCRLRPSAQKRSFWAKGPDEPLKQIGFIHKTNWTELIQSCLPQEILEEVFVGDKERIAKVAAMRNVFIEVLRCEEDFVNGKAEDSLFSHQLDRMEEKLIRGKRKADHDKAIANVSDKKLRKLLRNDTIHTNATPYQALPVAPGISASHFISGNMAGRALPTTSDGFDPLAAIRSNYGQNSGVVAGSVNLATQYPVVGSTGQVFELRPRYSTTEDIHIPTNSGGSDRLEANRSGLYSSSPMHQVCGCGACSTSHVNAATPAYPVSNASTHSSADAPQYVAGSTMAVDTMLPDRVMGVHPRVPIAYPQHLVIQTHDQIPYAATNIARYPTLRSGYPSDGRNLAQDVRPHSMIHHFVEQPSSAYFATPSYYQPDIQNDHCPSGYFPSPISPCPTLPSSWESRLFAGHGSRVSGGQQM